MFDIGSKVKVKKTKMVGEVVLIDTKQAGVEIVPVLHVRLENKEVRHYTEDELTGGKEE